MAFTSNMNDKTNRAITMIGEKAESNLLEATMEWHSGVVEDMLVGERYGKEYRIPGSRRTYRASNPNEPPATRTGALRSSYRFRVVEQGNSLVGEVGSPLDYSVYLEYGTRRMAPRPHLLPAYYSRETPIKDILTRKWF